MNKVYVQALLWSVLLASPAAAQTVAYTRAPELLNRKAIQSEVALRSQILLTDSNSVRAEVWATVGTDGMPANVRIEQSSGSARVDSAALGIVEAMRFRVGDLNGQAVAVTVLLPVLFRAQPIAERTAIYIEAAAAEMDSVQATLSEDEAEVVWDDFMWYRAGAYEHLETRHIPVLRMVGRRPLTFMVNGVPRRYDLTEATSLDVVVLYDQNREPLIIAPVDIGQADEYFK